MLADDVKMYCKIKASNDLNLLQCNLNKLALWIKSKYLSLNYDKCNIITFSRKQTT